MTLEQTGPMEHSADRGYFAGMTVAWLNAVHDPFEIELTKDEVFEARNQHLGNEAYGLNERSLDDHPALSSPIDMLRLLVQHKAHGYRQSMLRVTGAAALQEQLTGLLPTRPRSALLLNVGSVPQGHWLALLDQRLIRGVRSWIVYDSGESEPPYLAFVPVHELPKHLIRLRINCLVHRPSDTPR